MPHFGMRYLDTRDVDVDRLRPFPNNARIHDDQALDESVETNDQYRAVVGRPLPDGNVQLLAGHGTVAALTRNGHELVRVELIEADDSEALRINLVDNASQRQAGYDEALLVEQLQQAVDLGVLVGTGYDEQAYRELVEKLNPEPAPVVETPKPWPDELIIAEAFTHFRAEGFPYPRLPRYQAMQALNRLAETDTGSLLHTTTAYRVPDLYQPHRFSTPIPGKVTAVQAFDDDVKLEHAFKIAMDYDRTLTPMTLLSALAFVRNAQLAAQFRPGFALLMYRRFAPAGGTVLDTSTGFGGRLVGFLASHCSSYIGIDPNALTYEGNQRMVADLAPAGKHVELICAAAEDVARDERGRLLEHDGLRESCDFAFTSPPYFGKERYSAGDDELDKTQSWSRYEGGEAWRDGFLEPMLELQLAALKPGSHNCVNIADVSIKGETYPLVEWTVQLGKRAGFEHVRTEQFPIPRAPGTGQAQVSYEPVVVLRRPA